MNKGLVETGGSGGNQPDKGRRMFCQGLFGGPLLLGLARKLLIIGTQPEPQPEPDQRSKLFFPEIQKQTAESIVQQWTEKIYGDLGNIYEAITPKTDRPEIQRCTPLWDQELVSVLLADTYCTDLPRVISWPEVGGCVEMLQGVMNVMAGVVDPSSIGYASLNWTGHYFFKDGEKLGISLGPWQGVMAGYSGYDGQLLGPEGVVAEMLTPGFLIVAGFDQDKTSKLLRAAARLLATWYLSDPEKNRLPEMTLPENNSYDWWGVNDRLWSTIAKALQHFLSLEDEKQFLATFSNDVIGKTIQEVVTAVSTSEIAAFRNGLRNGLEELKRADAVQIKDTVLRISKQLGTWTVADAWAPVPPRGEYLRVPSEPEITIEIAGVLGLTEDDLQPLIVFIKKFFTITPQDRDAYSTIDTIRIVPGYDAWVASPWMSDEGKITTRILCLGMERICNWHTDPSTALKELLSVLVHERSHTVDSTDQCTRGNGSGLNHLVQSMEHTLQAATLLFSQGVDSSRDWYDMSNVAEARAVLGESILSRLTDVTCSDTFVHEATQKIAFMFAYDYNAAGEVAQQIKNWIDANFVARDTANRPIFGHSHALHLGQYMLELFSTKPKCSRWFSDVIPPLIFAYMGEGKAEGLQTIVDPLLGIEGSEPPGDGIRDALSPVMAHANRITDGGDTFQTIANRAKSAAEDAGLTPIFIQQLREKVDREPDNTFEREIFDFIDKAVREGYQIDTNKFVTLMEAKCPTITRVIKSRVSESKYLTLMRGFQEWSWSIVDLIIKCRVKPDVYSSWALFDPFSVESGDPRTPISKIPPVKIPYDVLTGLITKTASYKATAALLEGIRGETVDSSAAAIKISEWREANYRIVQLYGSPSGPTEGVGGSEVVIIPDPIDRDAEKHHQRSTYDDIRAALLTRSQGSSKMR